MNDYISVVKLLKSVQNVRTQSSLVRMLRRYDAWHPKYGLSYQHGRYVLTHIY